MGTIFCQFGAFKDVRAQVMANRGLPWHAEIINLLDDSTNMLCKLKADLVILIHSKPGQEDTKK